MKQGSIYHVDLDPTLGREQAGKRYVLVLSAAAYSTTTEMTVVASITQGGDYARVRGFSVPLTGLGLQTQGIVRLDQIRGVDMRVRSARFVEAVPSAVMDDILQRVLALFEAS